MRSDAFGLKVSTDVEAAIDALDATIVSYLSYRVDVPVRLKALLDADPDFALAHIMRGCFTMLGFRASDLPVVREAIAAAARLSNRMLPREEAHLRALSAWAGGDPEGALRIWTAILAEYPSDVLAFRLHHFVAFWLGRPEAMVSTLDSIRRAWQPEMPAYGAMLSCCAFASEEAGLYTPAENYGREAVAIDPGDPWGAHAVAHVLQMQGRTREGIDWIDTLAPNWHDRNNLRHHLYWHGAMYHLEHADFEQVLALYDNGFRNLASPLTQAAPDLYIDVQNAVSMLFRLERQGVDVGQRWDELAVHAQARIDDSLSGFSVPHWMLALVRTGRRDDAARMRAALAETAAGQAHASPTQAMLAGIALPICDAIIARADGRCAEACERMRPVLGSMYRLGGSHAQQDLLEQLFLDCALAAGRDADVALLLQRVRARCPVPPERRIGYRMAVHDE
ncbi:MAG: tetratricopeptide repeat protein [Burkholderiaceae bacterium]